MKKMKQERVRKYEKPTVVAFDIDNAICKATCSVVGSEPDPWKDEASDDASIHGLSDDNMKTVFD